MRIGDETIKEGDHDLYEILGFVKKDILHRPPDTNTIRKAYKKLALKYHPDRSGGDERQFQLIVRAYKILSDPGLRQQYDALILGGRGGISARSEKDMAEAAERMTRWMKEYIHRVETGGEDPMDFLSGMAGTLLDSWLTRQPPKIVQDIRNMQRIASQGVQLYSTWSANSIWSKNNNSNNSTSNSNSNSNRNNNPWSNTIGSGSRRRKKSSNMGSRSSSEHPLSPVIPVSMDLRSEPEPQEKMNEYGHEDVNEYVNEYVEASVEPVYLQIKASLKQWFCRRKRRIRLTLPFSGREVELLVPLYQSSYECEWEWNDPTGTTREERVIISITVLNDPMESLPRWSFRSGASTILILTTDSLNRSVEHPTGTKYYLSTTENSGLGLYWTNEMEGIPTLIVVRPQASPLDSPQTSPLEGSDPESKEPERKEPESKEPERKEPESKEAEEPEDRSHDFDLKPLLIPIARIEELWER